MEALSTSLAGLVALTLGEAGEKRVGGFSLGNPGRGKSSAFLKSDPEYVRLCWYEGSPPVILIDVVLLIVKCWGW